MQTTRATFPIRFSIFSLLFLFRTAKANKDGKLETCKPIHKVDLRTTKMGWVSHFQPIRIAARLSTMLQGRVVSCVIYNILCWGCCWASVQIRGKLARSTSFFPLQIMFSLSLPCFLSIYSETFTIFSGGLSTERDGKSPCITVLQGRSTTVLEMEHPVVDFITICESPWSSGMCADAKNKTAPATASTISPSLRLSLSLSLFSRHRNARAVCHRCIATKRSSINWFVNTWISMLWIAISDGHSWVAGHVLHIFGRLSIRFGAGILHGRLESE